MRLDIYLQNIKNISRNKSQAIIKAWNVKVNSKVITKVGFDISEKDNIEIEELDETKYVARSAIKLKWYLENNKMDISWFNCLDIWSSTGWFCQILLENEVKSIIAVDVWTNQLHESLRDNEKIKIREKTDIRKLEKLENIDLITCDVSFISLSMIIDSIIRQMNHNTIAILLFKPQFEVWNKYINKKWVVKDEKYSKKSLDDFLELCKIKWLKIKKVDNSILTWENWNKEIFIEMKMEY